MRTQDYLKQAADNLRQAVITSKQEADEIRKSLALLDQQRRDRLNSMRNEEKQRLHLAAVIDNDQSRAANVGRARQLKNEESQLEQSYTRDKRLLDEELSLKQRVIDELNTVAQDLDNRSSQMNNNRLNTTVI